MLGKSSSYNPLRRSRDDALTPSSVGGTSTEGSSSTGGSNASGNDEESESPERTRRRAGSIGDDTNPNDGSGSNGIDVDGSNPGSILDRMSLSQSSLPSTPQQPVPIVESEIEVITEAINQFSESGENTTNLRSLISSLPSSSSLSEMTVITILKHLEDLNKIFFDEDDETIVIF